MIRTLAAALTVGALLTASPAIAVTIPNGPAASADAYGLLVDVRLLPTQTPLTLGPESRSTQEYPRVGNPDPAEDQLLGAGPLPADGSVVESIGVMSTIAGANGAPNAVASAEVAGVSLLDGAITADVVRAQANTDCVNDPNATGTTFVNLSVNGTAIEQTPEPNTVIDLVVAKVILNEQRPAFDGRGIVVNAIHVVSTTTGDPLFRGDVIVSHAMSTVNCTNGKGSTGSTNELKMVKDASPHATTRGGTVTYTAKVTNTSDDDCLVNRFVEHLAAPFEFVSTSGDFGNALDDTEARPGGGADLILGNGTVIESGKTFTQTFVVKVKDDAVDGVYFNNLEILCANLGNYVKGLDAPVRIGTQQAPPKVQPPAKPRDENALPRTGANEGLLRLGGLGLLAAAYVARRARKAVSF